MRVSESVCEGEGECVRECASWGRGWRIYTESSKEVCVNNIYQKSLWCLLLWT